MSASKNASEQSSLAAFSELLETVRRLRSPGGCPWDQKQTHASLRPYLIEEAYELLDVLDEIKSNKDVAQKKDPFLEELGDVLLQVLLHAQMASEENHFSFQDVAQKLNEKLIRRHPHVFENASANTPEEALQNWEVIKTREKSKKDSLLDGMPKNLPSLQKAARIIDKVTRVGFQWKDMEGPLEKVQEEVDELKAEISQGSKNRDQIESELGDVLFTLCNLAFLHKVEPETALRKTIQKFDRRFRFVEKTVLSKGKTVSETSLGELDQYWNQAKEEEKR